MIDPPEREDEGMDITTVGDVEQRHLPADMLAAIRLQIHDRACRPGCLNRDECSFRWVQHQWGMRAAIEHLLDHPRDAAGARLALHDGVCVSCRDDDGTVVRSAQSAEHAKGQASTVAWIRKALAAYQVQS